MKVNDLFIASQVLFSKAEEDRKSLELTTDHLIVSALNDRIRACTSCADILWKMMNDEINEYLNNGQKESN